MQTIGIDVGKRQHVAAICHAGEREARRAVLRFSSDRAGFTELRSSTRLGVPRSRYYRSKIAHARNGLARDGFRAFSQKRPRGWVPPED